MIKFATLFLLMATISTLNAQTIKVFILAGQSNAQGHGDINPISTQGTLSHFIANDATNEFEHLQLDNGNWAIREDVWIRYDHESNGLLTGELQVGYGGWEGQIGPELGMGHILGESFDEQVLIIKTCWGGKSLAVDFRPPSSGGTTGPYYHQMISDIQSTINNISTEFPDYNNETLELAGFVWFQGWNDGELDSYIEEYESNLINLIGDLRSDLSVPELPFLVGLTGNGGYEINPNDGWIYDLQTRIVPAQINAAQSPINEWVNYSETRGFWREVSESPADAAHHWHNNAESYLRIGNAFGIDMLELIEEITLSTTQTSPSTYTISPSLANKYINITGYKEELEVRIFNTLGNQILVTNLQEPSQKIDISTFNIGMYYAQVKNLQNNKSSFLKFIKI